MAGATIANSVTVFALYISSPLVVSSYRHPKVLWAVCPILLYALGRTLMMAHRRMMHDDPIVFALKDNVTRLAVLLTGVLFLIAI